MESTPLISERLKLIYGSVRVFVDDRAAINIKTYNTLTKQVSFYGDRIYFEGEKEMFIGYLKNKRPDEELRTEIVENSHIEFLIQ